MITLTREEAQQVLDALEKISMGGHPDWANDITPILRARLAQPEPKNKALTHEENKAHNQKILDEFYKENAALYEPEPKLEVKFEQVANGIEVGYDFFGGVDIRLGGEFVYVHINYDPRYTHNAARTQLADKIVGLLTGNTAPPQRVYCSCGDGIVPEDGALCGTCVSLKKMREWQGLTDEEIMSLLPGAVRLPPGWSETVRAIEAKLKEKNA
jgi:hypothetical protein